VDPRSVLGLDARAGRSDARLAHRRLVAHLNEASPPPPLELRRLVDAAYTALNAPGRPRDLSVDPYRLLDVTLGADEETVRAAYRRLARVVHPDVGGTDELFRAVEAAQDALLHPPEPPRFGERPDDWMAWARRWHVDAEPPGRPPPRGPWHPPDNRPALSRWRALLDMVLVTGAFVFAAIVAVSLASLGRGFLLLTVVVSIVGAAYLPRLGLERLLQAFAALTAPGRDAMGESDPERFLVETCLDAPVGREREDVLYAHYIRWCNRQRVEGVSPWVFVETLRRAGLLYVKSSAWEDGIIVGVRLRRAND
jgi:hypothetical protein